MLPEVQEAPPHEIVSDGDEEGSVAVAAILAALGVLCVASAVSTGQCSHQVEAHRTHTHHQSFKMPVSLHLFLGEKQP